jgi:PAS domain S-box-containing protein
MRYAVANENQPARRLRAAEALLRMAAGLGRLGAWRVEPDGRTMWSPEVCAIHEVPPGHRCSVAESLSFYAPEDRPTVTRAFEACLQHGQAYDLELRLRTARGNLLWVRAIGEPEFDAQGKVVGVHGALQDITRQKQAAEETRELAERLAVTLESLTEPFYTLDRDWRFTYVNAEAERILQRTRAELLGQVIWERFPETVHTILHREYQRAMATRTTAEFELHYPPLEIWVQVRAYPSQQGLAASFRDITGQRRAQQEVLRLNAELEQRVQARTAELEAANRELDAFAHSIAHDLRSPMAAINAFASVIAEMDGDKLSARGLRYLHRICDAGSQLDAMTDSLLALARLSQTPVHRQAVDLVPIAAAILARLREQDPRPLDVALPARLPAQADPVLLTQVLENLLGNAWKFTRHTPAPRIEVGAETGPEGECVFFVRDNGPGFDMAHAHRLFEPFFRLHADTEFEGSGIGLATVHRIIRRHDGRIWPDAAEGQGAVFRFTLGPQGRAGPAAR